jgi:hypothetical protein
MANGPDQNYGLSTDLFVNRKRTGESLVVGGVGEDESRWTRVLSQRAAQMLWHQLTQLLFPEKSEMVTALVSTTPLRSDSLPTVTTHITVDGHDNGIFDIVGWVGEHTWLAQLTEVEARRFWKALDVALFPVGWQGRNVKKQ